MLFARRWFLCLLVGSAFCAAYGWLVAPRFEPPPLRVVQGHEPLALPTHKNKTRKFDHLFPPEAWQRSTENPPKVIESDQCTFLLQEYTPLPDGQMELKPCTLIFYVGEPVESDQPGIEGPQRRTIVLDVPDGALLLFDRDLDLTRAEIGKLLGGRLRGNISIYSPPTRTDVPDDLEIKTRNIQINEQRAWTPHEVTFRYGNSYGSGRDLTLELANDSVGGKTPSIKGIKRMQLGQVEKLHIDLAGASLFPEPPQAAAAAAPPQPQPPIEVRCKGPFQFDFAQQVAAFLDRVEVTRLNPLGPPDKVLCHRLAFQLQPSDKDKGAAKPLNSKPTAAKGDNQTLDKASERLKRVWAEGNPAVIQAPSATAEIRAARIDFDLEAKRVVLAPSPSLTQVLLQYGQSEISAHQLEYETGAEGRIGKLWAEGPGKLTYSRPADGKGPEQFTAHWQRELRVRPHENNQVLSLLGQARIGVGEMGSFAADELHLWAIEGPPIPSAPKKAGAMPTMSTNLIPDRLLAIRDVQIESSRLTGNTQRLEAWFTAPLIPGVAKAGPPATFAGQNSRANPPAAGPGPMNPFPIRQPAEDAANAQSQPTSKYDVTGDLIRLQWLVVGASPTAMNLALGDLSVEGNVRITEVETAKPDEEPLLIVGTAVQVRSASSPNATLQLAGKPAKLSARGLSLSGAVVNVHRGENRAWIDGPGQAVLPVPANMALAGPKPREAAPAAANVPLLPPVPARLTWKGGLNFDGQTITVTKDIALQSDQQSATAQLLEVTLAKRLDFSQTQQTEPLELARLTLDGGVSVENSSPDPQTRQQASRELLKIKNLSVNRLTGEIKADGPGWISTTRRGSALPAAPGAAPGAVPAGGPLAGMKGDALTYLYVEFDQGIVGNLNQHQAKFVGQVRAVFGPVADFRERLEETPADKRPEQAVLLSCDELQLMELLFPGGQKWIELVAQGNTTVEGKSFNAQAHRIAYTTDKEQLIMEGDGRSDAQIWYQSGPGKPKGYATAGKLTFWRKTNEIEWDRGGQINLDQLQGVPLSKPKK